MDSRVGTDIVTFDVDPAAYRHWRVEFEAPVATLKLDVDEEGGLRPGYVLKLNSYDLGVDIELHDILQRIRFEHPEIRTVVLTSAKERMFCSGANIYMLRSSPHSWKVNFCKFTNETRNGIEQASGKSGLKFLAAVNGACAGGGYEVAHACDEIAMVDDGSSTVSLPEVPLLGVLPGTGGLTRVVDKRHVRRDLADVFCTTSEGVRAQRAREWGLVDSYAVPAKFADLVAERAAALAAQSDRPADARGIQLTPLQRRIDESGLHYPHLDVELDAGARTATLVLHAPDGAIAGTPEAIQAAGADWYPLALARALDDAILMLRTNYLELGTWKIASRGDPQAVLAMDEILAAQSGFWLVREVVNFWERVLSRLDVSSRSLIAVIDEGSAFAGTFFETALAADRSYMLDLSEAEEGEGPQIALSAMNFGAYAMATGPGRLSTRFYGDEEKLNALRNGAGKLLDAAAALDAGLVTFAPDDIDWEDEVRIAVEERASLSPDALTGMEASLRFAGNESMQSKIFGRLTAWQNWIFNRPNAVGKEGALQSYGSGSRAKFDWERV
ncbi:MAG: 2,3-epoxybenzoyl-CoA dihydrolase [Sneathiellaceae bacterium]